MTYNNIFSSADRKMGDKEQFSLSTHLEYHMIKSISEQNLPPA